MLRKLASHRWEEPLEFARRVPVGEHWAFLYSGMQLRHSGRYSLLACEPEETFEANDFDLIAERLGERGPWHGNAWFGYLGYELRHALEKSSDTAPSPIALPRLRMTRFNRIYRFDHQLHHIAEYGILAPLKLHDKESVSDRPPRVTALQSNMTKAEYLKSVQDAIDAIANGDFYQANLTRKFYGELQRAPDPFALFTRLSRISPSPYSAYMQWDGKAILSSSPECFLSISANGEMVSRPIKGSAPPEAGEAEKLAASGKNRAENLMIVDLMRNDFSRVCDRVSVSALHELESYATIHHLVSTVSGHKRDDVSTLEAVKACFPPGSMTGAPKIRVMEWCAQKEKMDRGVYSGAIGWFGGDGSCDLSVVIRTLVLEGRHFEFQTGGGIVSDSEPEDEWKETLVKARAMRELLGIEEEQLATL